jgi:acetoacetate decarboxylase
MRRRDLLSTFGVAAGAITFASVRGQAADMPGANAAQAPSNPHPPYLVSVTEQLGIVFEADESALKSLLPPNVKPAAGNTVGLNMYRAQVLGLVPYAASYLWINVDGFDSPDGTKGRWMSQGWYGPEPVTTVFKTQFGYPVELGATRVEREGNRIHAVLNSGGADLINAAIALKEANPNASVESSTIPPCVETFRGAPHRRRCRISSLTAFPSQARSSPPARYPWSFISATPTPPRCFSRSACSMRLTSRAPHSWVHQM